MKSTLLINVILFMCCLVFSSQSFSENSPFPKPIKLEDGFKSLDIIPSMHFIEDTQQNLSFKDVLKLKQSDWQIHPDRPANFGLTTSAFWLHFSLENPTKNAKALYVHLNYALVDHINLYQTKSGELIREYVSGDHLPFAERPVDYPTFLFPVTIEPNTISNIYIRVDSQGALRAPISVWDAKHFLFNSQTFLFLYGCFLSAMLMMSAYNFCLFLTIRDKHYLLYSTFILVATGMHSSLDGFAYQWFWPNSPEWHQVSAIFFISIGCFVSVLFTQSLLSVPKQGIIRLGTTFLLIMTACSALISLVISYRHSVTLNAFTTLSTMLGIVLICAVALKHKPGIARYFVLAWGVYFGGIILKSSSNIGLIDSSFLTEYTGNIGAVCAMLIMSLALAERIKSERRDKEHAQLESIGHLSRFESLYKNALEGVFTLSTDGKLLSANPAFYKLMGNEGIEDFNKSDTSKSSFKLTPKRLERLLKVLRKQNRVDNHETQLSNQLGVTNWVNVSARLVTDPFKGGEVIEGTLMNINERKAAEEKLKHLANHDSLTGLVNRRAFEIAINESLEKVKKGEQESSLLYLDLDQFKIVNDLCGHTAGDLLLKNLSQRLHRKIDNFDKNHIIARLGGDEFGLLLNDIPFTNAQEIAEQIRLIIEEFLFVWEGNRFSLAVSIGLVEILPFHISTEQLMVMADTACYLAKDHGRNRVHTFMESDQELQIRQLEMQWVSDIKDALAEDNFFLVFQDIVSNQVKNDRHHYEILLRLMNKNGNLCSPGQFLTVAERYNLMPSIDRWVIKHYFSWLSQHPEHLSQLSCASINLSPQTIGDDTFPPFLTETFNTFGIPHHKICFEITESMAITHIDNTHAFIDTLHNLGCRFALDDFGTGFSSYAYLKELQVDYLKIDGMFIKNLTEDEVSLAMVKSISDVAQAIGIETIAEFVETKEIHQKLISLGITYSQGYFIHKPVKLDSSSFSTHASSH